MADAGSARPQNSCAFSVLGGAKAHVMGLGAFGAHEIEVVSTGNTR
jgi:hypothetical protein